MSIVPVQALVDEAAIAIGDPRKTRVRIDEWLPIYNASQRELCLEANILQFRGTFDLTTSPVYGYPKEMTVMTYLETNLTPADPDSWQEVKEIFEDEFRGEVSGRYPNATVPERYFAERNWFYQVPRPTAGIVAAGRITYFGKPDRIYDISTALLQVPDFCEDYVRHRMVVYGLAARNRLDESLHELKLWRASLETLMDKMDDRSQDRRSTIAPRKNRFIGMN